MPLDYANEAAGTTYISFIKWKTNSTKPAQDVLMNPGGPGATGTQFLIDGLSQFTEGLGTEFNFVSFDPRGVNNSGPSLSCFPGQNGTSRFYRGIEASLQANDTRSYYDVFQKAAAFGDFCTAAHGAANDTAKYANTVAVANDMKRYIELLAQSNNQDPSTSKLYYYGFSYGTVLGTTFASLFPDSVGRIIVDGVADGEDYYQGQWLNNFVDTDEAFETFFEYCFEAGKNCSFWANSSSAIKARYQAIVDDLSLNPIPISSSSSPAIATIDVFKKFQLSTVYTPLEKFPLLADILVELEQRNATTFAKSSGIGTLQDDCFDELNGCTDFEPRPFIACTDANGRTNLSTFDDWVNHANTLIAISKYAGEAAASETSPILCRNLNIKAPESQVFQGYPGANRTSNPLLFFSTLLDPVTPLRNAEKMAARFGGAGLLKQNSTGHCTTSAPSECTWRHARRYMKNGTLPEAGTVCQPDVLPFAQ